MGIQIMYHFRILQRKKKAQQYIGLDMAVEKADKDKFLKEIVLEWLQKAKANGRIVN